LRRFDRLDTNDCWDIDLIKKWPPGIRVRGPKYDELWGFTVQPIFQITGNPEISFEKWHREFEKNLLSGRGKYYYDQYVPNHLNANKPEYGLQLLWDQKFPSGGQIQLRPELGVKPGGIFQGGVNWQFGNGGFQFGGEIHGSSNGLTGGSVDISVSW
jgi:hypothetical protein